MGIIKYLVELWMIIIVSFYSLTVQDADGNNLVLGDFEGKKVLVVNVAATGRDTSQLRELEQLHQLHKDSLVILAVPSNDFGSLPYSSSEAKVVLQNQFGAHYRILSKSVVSDSATLPPLYHWLTNVSQNGVTDAKVVKDFYKFLVNGQGNLVGIFSTEIRPMDTVLTNAIAH